MNRRETLIIGASGFVGWYLMTALRQDRPVTGTYTHHRLPGLISLDMTDTENMRRVFDQVQPELVLCPARHSYVEGVERDPEGTRKFNIHPFSPLLELVRSAGSCLVFFSTEYVFDGTAGPYSEDAPTNPINEYGRQKLAVERMIQSALENYLIIRLSAPYGWEYQNKNFVVNLLRDLRAEKPVAVPCDQIVTPTYIVNFVCAVKALVVTGCTGVYHVAGSEPMVRTEFAKLVAEVFDLDSTLVRPVLTSELNLLAPRPVSAGLKTERAQARLGFRLTPPKEGLKAMRATEAEYAACFSELQRKSCESD
ncbi:MAG: hypothetical protein A3F68_11270 [Acidobacteria bacterium RIFCSPLOWO2_12_FULL_54_10]|nr:MAG: hypothetical protein A3F68_11270 [Acidobacteria bacterium RIFCSPLOWO2_12_FULL_54_10]